MSATTPATCGQAMLVPSAAAVPPGSEVTRTPVVAVETMATPGALTEGWYSPILSPVNERCFSSPPGSGPRIESSNSTPPEENDARWWFRVPAPTEMTQGATEYGLIAISVVSLPAAKTTTIPASWAALVAWLIGSSGSNILNEEPQELFATRIFQSARCASMSSYAARMLKMNAASPVP